MLALTSNIELIHMLEGIFDGGAVHQLRVPGGEVRELAADVEVGWKEVADGVVVVLDERKIGDGALVADEPFLLAQDIVENTEDSLDFTLEPNDGRGETFGVVEHEPLAVTEGRSLMGSLIEKPGIQVSLLLLVGVEELPLSIEALGNILENGIAFPNDLIVVRVIDECRDTPIGVELAILLGLVLLLGKVENDFIVGETKLLHKDNELQPVKTRLGEVESKLGR